MACIVTCKQCSKTYRAEPEFIGTLWAQVLSFECPFCKFTSTVSMAPTTFFDGKPIVPHFDIDEDESCSIGQCCEASVQKYLQENFRHYGFSSISEPHRIGPDFRGTRIGSKTPVFIEVECSYENYFLHGHDTDRNFSKVEYLFVLEREQPRHKLKNKLPPQIITADQKHFLDWYFTNENSGWIKGVTQMLKMEFNNIHFERCDDKERDMANCPNCEKCAYLDDSISFHKMATLYVLIHHSAILRTDFSWGNVKKSSLIAVYESLL